MLISGLHFEFFFSPKEAELQVRRLEKILSPKVSCVPVKSQKKEMLGTYLPPPPPWALKC